ncbi:trans-sialidase, putative, partial [Trypanosoma cruzi marinkellei]
MVSIDGVPTKGGPIPVMGVRAGSKGENKLMELSYDKEKNWQVLCGDETLKLDSSTLGAEKTQHVVILVRNGTRGSAYVDGKRVGGDASCALGSTDLKEISHFYIGGDGRQDTETRRCVFDRDERPAVQPPVGCQGEWRHQRKRD